MTSPHRLRVMMISKACIVGIYQRKLEAIAQHGIDLQVVVPPSWKDKHHEIPLERAYTDGYELVTLPIRFNGNFHLHHYVGLAAQMRDFQPHLVHIDEEPYNLATWQALRAAKNVQAKALFFTWQNIYRNYPPPFSWGERWVLNNSDYAIMGTQSAAEVWQQKGYTGAQAIIPQFGTDTTLFQPAKHRPDRPFTMGFFGRLTEEKGIQHLIAAAARLTGDWQLRIVGGGLLLPTLQQQVAALGIQERVQFVGAISSAAMPAQYHELDVFVLPSLTRPNWKEQFGRVLIESMASGVPLVGSSSGDIPNVIGDAGLIFPEGDVDALYQHLQSLQDDATLRATLKEKGLRRVEAHFTQDRIAAATVEVYHKMAETLRDERK